MSAIDTTDLEPTGYPSTEGLLDVPDPCDDLLTALLKSEKRAYRRGVRDGKKAKPLRWRTGLVGERYGDFIMFVTVDEPGEVDVWTGLAIPGHGIQVLGVNAPFPKKVVKKWLPLSEILELVGGE